MVFMSKFGPRNGASYFNDGGDAHAAAHAQRRHAVAEFAPVHIFKRRKGYLSSPRGAVDELHEHLTAGASPAPCVLVSASFGAFTALLFAAKYPLDVAGIVLADPSHPRQGPVALEVLSTLGPHVTEPIAKFRAMFAGFGPMWDEGCRDVEGVVSLGDIPVLVLAAGRPEAPSELPADVYRRLVADRHRQLGEYAALSTKGDLQIVPDVGHGIAVEAPDVVREAIFRTISRIR